jgi:hypothetical protein
VQLSLKQLITVRLYMIKVNIPKWLIKDTEPNQDACLVALRATKFAMSTLFADMSIIRTINVELKIPEPAVPDTEEDLDLKRIGHCESMYIENKKSELNVVCSPVEPTLIFLDCIFHELQHAKQAFENKLLYSFIPGKKPLALWNGKAFSTRYIKYEDWPWEIEARKVANDMLNQFLQKYPNTVL